MYNSLVWLKPLYIEESDLAGPIAKHWAVFLGDNELYEITRGPGKAVGKKDIWGKNSSSR